jgi:hypothetical protein
MGTTTDIRSAASPWAAVPVCTEQFGIAPNASGHGSGLSFAGYPTTGATASTKVTTAAPQHSAMTLAAVRKDDARVPPRGRPL